MKHATTAIFAAALCVTAASAGPFDGATWIAAPDGAIAAPRFSATFAAAKDGPAEIAICGLGQYTATLNGKPLGRGDEFNLPGWSRTSKTCLYNVFRPVLKAGATNTSMEFLGSPRNPLAPASIMPASGLLFLG